jgi:hypothetical protein
MPDYALVNLVMRVYQYEESRTINPISIFHQYLIIQQCLHRLIRS